MHTKTSTDSPRRQGPPSTHIPPRTRGDTPETAARASGMRLEQLREQTTVRTEQAAPAPWSARLAELAARPLDGETAGAVIA